MWEALEYYLNMCRVTTDAEFMCCFVCKSMLLLLDSSKVENAPFCIENYIFCSCLLSSRFGPLCMCNEVLLVGTSVGSFHFSNLR